MDQLHLACQIPSMEELILRDLENVARLVLQIERNDSSLSPQLCSKSCSNALSALKRVRQKESRMRDPISFPDS